MAGPKIKLKDQLGRVVRLPVAQPPKSDAPPAAPAPPERQGLGATVWKLIREVPSNLQKLAKLADEGFTSRGADGEWHQRSITAGDGIEVENGDGVSADPVVSLAPVIRTAAATVSALRLLSESGAGVAHLDPSDAVSVAGMVGVSITAGGAGADIKLKTAGTIDDAGWSWAPGFVFAGPGGTLSPNPASIGLGNRSGPCPICNPPQPHFRRASEAGIRSSHGRQSPFPAGR